MLSSPQTAWALPPPAASSSVSFRNKICSQKNIFCVLRCWTASWTWWKRRGGQWACSDAARSQTARNSTTGDGVQVSRRTHAKEAQAPLPSPRHTAPTPQSQVGFVPACHRNRSFSYFCDWRLLFFYERGLLHDSRMKPNHWKSVSCYHFSQITKREIEVLRCWTLNVCHTNISEVWVFELHRWISDADI